MRKLRKTGAVDEHGNLVTIPRLPSVTAEPSLRHSNGSSRAAYWRQPQVIRVIAMVTAKVGGRGTPRAATDRILGELIDGFEQRAARRG
jgi:hypothetical protein